MIQVYFPIAEISLSLVFVLAIGGVVGFLSGLFGVGGGFLMTPLLIFIGVSPAVAVGTQANQLVAASVSGVLAHWRRRNVDIKMGLYMVGGSVVGTVIGVWVFERMQALGYIDLVISALYVVFLGLLGGLMLVESISTLVRRRRPGATRGKLHHHTWLHGLPLKTRFHRSRLYISALLPVGIGLFGGILVAIMGIGGGFILVPAMIYVLGMPASVVAGTSLFQIIFATGAATLLHATTTHTVDALLALCLLLSGVIGAQLGTRASVHMKAEHGRLMLALLVLAVCLKLLADLVVTPGDPFSIEVSPIISAGT